MKNIILEYLQYNRENYISGCYISKELGISRAAVWKHIRELRRQGYRISARSNCGYRLDEEPDRLIISLLEERGIRYYRAVDSTNLTARRLAEEGCPSYTTVIAEEQLQGRGRLGRDWFSPPNSGLWFSIILRPEMIKPAAAAPVTLVTATSLASSLNKNQDLAVKIKWPNDLLIEGKKFGGILSEIKGEPDRIEYLIIGAGLNVNQEPEDFPAELKAQATSISAERGRFFDRTSLFLSLWEELCRAYELFLKEGFAPFRDRLLFYNSFMGREVNVTWTGGALEGLAVDLDQDGSLLVRDKKGKVHRIFYGEIN